MFTVTMMDDRYNHGLHKEQFDLECLSFYMEDPYEETEKGRHACLLGDCTYEIEDDGKRHRRVKNRCMGYLDADDPKPDFLARCGKFFDFWGVQWGFYTSFSATEEHPKFRVVFEFSRPVTPDEYKRIMCAVCYDITKNSTEVDPVSTRAAQLMFMPCINKNGGSFYQSYIFKAENESLDVDVFSEWIDMNYDGYYDQYMVVRSCSDGIVRESKPAFRPVKTIDPDIDYLPCGLKDPRSLNSIIGSFCKVYDIPAVLAEIIPGIYTQDGIRYKLSTSKSVAGAFIKDGSDSLYFYSMHQTDPIYGRDVNSWDLVLEHKFLGDSRAMYEWAKNLPAVQIYERERHAAWRQMQI